MPIKPQPCDARRCIWCRHTDGRGVRVRPLSPADLAWQFGEAEAALGTRSSHGALVDIALAGVQTGGGGRSNGVDLRMARTVRLAGEPGFDPVARHRCIRQRLERAAPAHLAVLRIAYSPNDWTACHSQVVPERGEEPNPLTAPQVYEAAHKAFGPEVLRLAPETRVARAFERRRRAMPTMPTPPKTDTPTARNALAGLFARDPLLARSARGAVLMAACGVCPGCGGSCGLVEAIVAQALAMLCEARAATGVQDPPRSRRVRSVRLEMPEPARPMLASEALL